MFGRHDRARRERESANAELINELRWQWRCACGSTALAQMIYTPSGATRAVPTIGHVDLGPPITFTVRIRPGQAIADFDAAAPALARAMNVAAIEVQPMAAPWVRIVLLTTVHEALPNRPWGSDRQAATVGT